MARAVPEAFLVYPVLLKWQSNAIMSETFLRFIITHRTTWLTLSVLVLAARCAVGADPFPTQALPGTDIGDSLPADYEPSGAVWHTGLSRLLTVSDTGIVSSMNADGSGISNWSVGGDLEGITVADPNSPFVYVGVENPDSILELNLNTGVVTRTFDLTPWLTGPANQGLEALTFLPDSNDSEGGLFYAGLQDDGKIYSFRLPILTSSTSTAVTPLTTITPVAGRNDISGLDYDIDNDVLYAIFDNSNLMRAIRPDGTVLAEWDLPQDDQEGVALAGDNLYIAEDSNAIVVWRYAPFPFLDDSPAADFDNDGDVDGADLMEWASDYGQNAGSDADEDGDSDGTDFLVWQRTLGTGVPALAARAVPEPSTCLLLAWGTLLSLRHQR